MLIYGLHIMEPRTIFLPILISSWIGLDWIGRYNMGTLSLKWTWQCQWWWHWLQIICTWLSVLDKIWSPWNLLLNWSYDFMINIIFLIRYLLVYVLHFDYLRSPRLDPKGTPGSHKVAIDYEPFRYFGGRIIHWYLSPSHHLLPLLSWSCSLCCLHCTSLTRQVS